MFMAEVLSINADEKYIDEKGKYIVNGKRILINNLDAYRKLSSKIALVVEEQ